MKTYNLIEYTQNHAEYRRWLDNIIDTDFSIYDDEGNLFFLSDSLLDWLDENCEDWSFSDHNGKDWLSFDFIDDTDFLAFRSEWSLIKDVYISCRPKPYPTMLILQEVRELLVVHPEVSQRETLER